MRLVRVTELVASGVLRIEDGNHGENRPRPDEFVDTGVPFIRAADMASGVVDYVGAGRINAVARSRIRKGVGAPGDVILSHKGTVGRIAVAPLDAPDYVCSPQTTFWRSLDTDKLDRRFLRYVMQSADFQRQLDVLKGQTDMAPYVSLTDQRSMSLWIPDISYQRLIGAVLGSIDDKIAANAHCVNVADQLACALFRECCDGTGMTLRSVAEVTMGSSPPGSSYNESGYGVPFYQGVRDFGMRTPTHRVWTDAPVRTAEAGDTLLSVRAPVGRTNLAGEHVCLGRGLAGLRSRTGRPMTLFHQVRAAEDSWAPFDAEGTVFGSINRANLESVVIPTVRAGLEGQLEAHLEAVEANIGAILGEIDDLARARDELLPLLMSGKVRVKDAEAIVEEAV
ncbi:hypothetical protein [Mycobacterium sp. DL592]|uniref:hypothetical protein n=1 Tax=Mycobacterium sp. DL592 TaxID=2675524 RepID=UPI00141E5F7B|nr:hypothetical protein [Mycobacterium sp. DL592]